MPRRLIMTMLVLIVPLFGLHGCSDDDDDPTGPGDGDGVEPGAEAGTYLMTSLHVAPWSSLSTIMLDGAGMFSYQRILDCDGDTEESGSGPYTIAENGRFTIGGTVHGVFNAACGLIAANEPVPGCSAGLDVGVRRGSDLDDATLSGTYRGAGFDFWYDGDWGCSSFVVRVEADGQGTATTAEEYTSTNFDDPATLTYSVAPDGQITFAEFGHLRGVVSPDGDILLLTLLAGDQEVGMYVLFREDSGLSDASLNGDYVYLWLSGTENLCEYGTIVFDGQGQMTATTLHDTEGEAPFSSSGTYAVQPDGRLLANGEDRGAISADGRLLVAVGLGDYPCLVLAVKQN